MSTIVVARMLSPDELGVYAIAAALSAFAAELKAFGVGSFLVRTDELTEAVVRRALGLTMLISWSLGATLLIGSGAFADFYGQADLQSLLWILSVSFFLSPFLAIGGGLYSRHFEFGTYTAIQISSQTLQLAVVVTLILAGWSYHSLAIATACGAFMQLALMGIFKPPGFVWKPRFARLAEIAKFGVSVSISNMLRRLALSLPDLVIGKLGTVREVALFSRGIGFLDFIEVTLRRSVQPVALPFLSQVKREDGDVATAYARAVGLTFMLMAPPLAVAGVASLPTIRMFFGEQWVASADLVSILAFWAIFRCVHALSPSVLVASRLEHNLLVREIVLVIATLVGLVLTVPMGLPAVAVAIVFVGVLDFLYTSVLLHKTVGLRAGLLARTLAPGILVSVFCAAAVWGLSFGLDFRDGNAFVVCFAVASVSGITWLSGVVILRHPVLDELGHLLRPVLTRLGIFQRAGRNE